MVQNENHLDGSKWNEDDIVISGIAARLPNCDSIEEFQQKVLAKVDLITDEPRRYQNGLYGAFSRYGLLKDLSKFDAKFFNIHPKQAERMDPQIRNLLEVAFESTIDAGLHPDDLKGTKTGVVVGVASSETQDMWSRMPDKINGYEYTGCTRTMFANRISHLLDLKGPSYSIDTASSTTLVAFHQAYAMIQDGVCDSCFVCGTDLVLNPCVTLMFQCLNMLSPEGKCKAFDITGDGYVRSEGIISVLLQKAKNAKRVYAKVISAGSNCDGYKDEGITFPSKSQQVKLFRRVAESGGIDPATIDFMEAHGSATRVGDPQEMNAVTEVFVEGRKTPLRTGSIKSNLGHAEPVSALSAVIKVCVAMECNIIPPNLHYNIPNPDIPALLDGRLKVITEPTPWDGGLVAVNSFGVGGANGHALLLSNKKVKQNILDTIPRLIYVSGVSKAAVETMLNKIHLLPKDVELYALLNNIYRKNINGHDYRGYEILSETPKKIIRSVPKYEKPNICFLFSGIESRWKSLESNLLNIPVFRDTIKNCEEELKSVIKNINLVSILKTLNNETSILNVILGTTSIQIALVEVFRSLDIIPQFLFGVNIGEIACGYGNNRYTLKQAILSSFYVGKTLQRLRYPASVAKIGINWNKCKLPSDISICTKILPQWTYISGPEQSVHNFLQVLQKKGVHCEKINSYGLDTVGIFRSSENISTLKDDLERILKDSNQPSEKCTTYTIHQSCLKSCVSGIIKSLTEASPVHKAINKIKNTVILEIGCVFNVEILQKIQIPSIAVFNEKMNDYNLVSSIGELYTMGYQPQIQNLYAKVKFPVSHGTPMIQSMIEWDHTDQWDVVTFAPKECRISGELDIEVDFDKQEFNGLLGNFQNNSQVFPKSFYIVLLQKTISRLQLKSMSDIPLVIENLFFFRETVLLDGINAIKFNVVILETSGKFEIWEKDSIVVSGHVHIPLDLKKEQIPSDLFDCTDVEKFCNSASELNKTDIYDDLSVKHYLYNESFMPLQSFDFEVNVAKVLNQNWCSLIESFLQIFISQTDFVENEFSSMFFIRKIIIDTTKYVTHEVTNVKFNKKLNVFKSDVLEIHGMKMESLPHTSQAELKLEYYDFIPFVSKNCENTKEASLQLALENWRGHNNLKVAEIVMCEHDTLLSTFINVNPLTLIDITIYSSENIFLNEDLKLKNIKFICKNISLEPVDTNCHILIASNVSNNTTVLNNIVQSVRMGGCILLIENYEENITINDDRLKSISSLSSNGETFILLKKINPEIKNIQQIITVTNDSFDWVQKIKKIPEQSEDNILIFAKGSENTGILNVLKSDIPEVKNKNMSTVLVEDKAAPLFFLTNETYSEQLNKMFPTNVYRDGIWGTYVPFTLFSNITIPTDNARIAFNVENDILTIDYIQSNPQEYVLQNDSGTVLCEVYNVSLNESMFEHNKSSIIKSKEKVKLEFSGYCDKKKVFGLAQEGTLSTTTIANKDFIWYIPKDWTLEEACTVPYSYILGYYALFHRGNLENMDSVFIIGSNSIAIASIYIALQYQCTIFVLLPNKKEKLLLKKLFPQIKDSHLIVPENDSFYLQILENTANRGVHIVFYTIPVQVYNFQPYICSLSENGKLILLDNEKLPEEILGSAGNMKCITFHRVNVSTLFQTGNATLRKIVDDFFNNSLKNGVIQPLPYIAFSDKDLINTLKFVSDKNETHKTVINIRNKECMETCTIEKIFLAKPRTYFHNNKVYIVLGGLKEFGLYVTNWMISQGVKNLIIISTENEQLVKIHSEKWKSLINRVLHIKVNEFSLKSCENIIKKASELGTIGGIFDFTQFETVNETSLEFLNEKYILEYFNNKINFLKNMDALSRKLCKNLDHFVSFSSVEFQYCDVELSTYSYANGIIQTIMKNREESNFNATLIQWGPIGESSSHVFYNVMKSINKLEPQSVNSCLEILHLLLQKPQPVFSYFITCKQTIVPKSKNSVILEGVAKFLGIKDTSSILPTVNMLELGLDSLIGTDIQQFLEMNHGIILNTQEVRELTFEKLKTLANNN